MNLVEKIEEYLKEAKTDHIVPGINKSYFSQKDTINKMIEFVDEGSKMGGKVWFGKLGRKDIYAIAFYSYDLGAEAKITSFKSKEEAQNVFDKIKNGISYDEIAKFLK